MGILGKIVSDAAVEPIKAFGNVIDGLFTSDEERLDKKIAMQRFVQNIDQIQAEINKVEAGHRSIFVAGWRPFIGWVCGVALFWHFLLYDIVKFFLPSRDLLMITNTDSLMTLVISLLGVGTLRTVEKLNGKAK